MAAAAKGKAKQNLVLIISLVSAISGLIQTVLKLIDSLKLKAAPTIDFASGPAAAAEEESAAMMAPTLPPTDSIIQVIVNNWYIPAIIIGVILFILWLILRKKNKAETKIDSSR